MKVIFITLLSLLSVTDITCQSDDTCQSFRRLAEEQCDQHVTSQGRPGKIGPHGPRGPRGRIGAPGGCACNPSEVENLREQIRVLNDSFQAVYSVVKSNRPLFCGVGIKDGRVGDEDLTESSSHGANYGARYARLDNTGDPRGYWISSSNRIRAGEWAQVHLRSPTRVTGVVTQGRPINYDEWITSFKILYGNSTGNLQAIQSNDGSEKIFQGNFDRNSHVTNIFPRPITARYFRLVVVTFNGRPALRMEYFTC